MSESNLVKWGSYDSGAAKAEAEALDKMGGGDFVKLTPGRNVLRVLPPRLGQKSCFVVTQQHTIELPGMKKAIFFNCPRKMGNKPCFSCQRADQLKATGDPRDFDSAYSYMPKLTVYANVIDRRNPEAGPRVLRMGKTIYDALVDLRNDTDAGGDFSDPINGFDIVITRKGTTKNDTEYKVTPARESSQLAPTMEEISDIISMMAELGQFSRVPSDRDIFKRLSDAGADIGDLRSDLEESTPVNRRIAGKPRVRTAQDDAMEPED